ncbi:phosphoethanolamine transferase [Aliivibrio finisterrensis]|uniref:Phosphoethanolamine transferase n=1 Tax=Aliivibrio finisterrensis TaxID=511998 RepID=A0A4Q5KC16_9GAMM|nr:phosphoethanolamine transferase [Aliivibrio finisterrensis]RYU42405.1 phosphoethanolamine transferase [Aliivibrio finisterrensis]
MYIASLVIIYLNYILLLNIFNRSSILSVLIKAIISTVFSIGISEFFNDISTIIVIILTFLFVVGYYYSETYGELSYGSVASIVESNSSEIKEYFSLIEKKVIIKTIIISILYMSSHFMIVSHSNVYLEFAGFIAFTLFLVSVFSMIYIYNNDDDKSGLPVKILKYNAIFNIFSHISEYYKYKRLTNKIKIKSSWTNVESTFPKKEVYIVVIGESACRDRFHVYGYEGLNTPKIEEMKGYKVISDAISPSTQTMTSIPRIFSINNLEDGVDFNLNIVDLANDAGFDTYWISNQGELGVADTAVTMIANRAKYSKFLQSEYSSAGSDFDLISEVEEIVKNKNESPKLIFLHTMGSHWNFCERSDLGRYKLDNIESESDCYDNTIFNTYMLLEDIREILNNNAVSYKMTYFSDHGLEKIDSFPYLTHGVGKLFSYSAAEIPLFFIDDDETPGEIINETYYLRDFVHTLSDWLNINADEVNNNMSLFNLERNKQEEYILNDSLKVINRGDLNE